MNSNFNRQFILIDFSLLDSLRFIAFINTAEFGTYLVLRRFVWRGGEGKPHFLGLNRLYEEEKLLACSVSNQLIAEKVGLTDITRVSKHLSKLEKTGVIRRIRTGRQSIHVLGEWIDYSEGKDGSRRLEWFYLDQKFGSQPPDLQKSPKQTWPKEPSQNLPVAPGQTWPKEPSNNREENREENIVNGDLKSLTDLKQPQEKTAYIARTILEQLGDAHSEKFYQLVAAKVPEPEIRRALAEVKVDGARDPAKLFTHKMKLYVIKQRKTRIG